jgi:hypothetical protein
MDSSSPLASTPVDRFEFLLATIAENQKKLEENQQDIKAMQVHLVRYHVTLEQNTKDVTTLIQKFDVLKFAVNNTIPVDFHVAIDKATSTLRSDFTTTLADTKASILTKNDIEHLVVQKWQEELDPLIQSHYDLKDLVSSKFTGIDQTIHTTIQVAINNHPTILHLTSSNPSTTTTTTTTRLISPRLSGFHQPESKDFSVSKLQKAIEKISLLGDLLRDMETFWDSILHAFTKCLSKQPSLSLLSRPP